MLSFVPIHRHEFTEISAFEGPSVRDAGLCYFSFCFVSLTDCAISYKDSNSFFCFFNTTDYVQQQLYWVDAKMHIIGSSDLEGRNYKRILKTHRNLGHPFAITVFEDYLYWTDWMSNAVHRISKFGHDNVSTIALDLKTPMDIHVYHIYRQPFCKLCSVVEANSLIS